MKPVSVKFQRIIMFIPVINCLNFFIWIYNTAFFYKKSPFLREFWIFISSVIPFSILDQLISKLLSNPTVNLILGYVFIYATLLLWGYRLANLQEEMESKRSHK